MVALPHVGTGNEQCGLLNFGLSLKHYFCPAILLVAEAKTDVLEPSGEASAF